jgi:hypothetical protein
MKLKLENDTAFQAVSVAFSQAILECYKHGSIDPSCWSLQGKQGSGKSEFITHISNYILKNITSCTYNCRVSGYYNESEKLIWSNLIIPTRSLQFISYDAVLCCPPEFLKNHLRIDPVPTRIFTGIDFVEHGDIIDLDTPQNSVLRFEKMGSQRVLTIIFNKKDDKNFKNPAFVQSLSKFQI